MCKIDCHQPAAGQSRETRGTPAAPDPHRPPQHSARRQRTWPCTAAEPTPTGWQRYLAQAAVQCGPSADNPHQDLISYTLTSIKRTSQL